jgi:hypothetical protein
LAHKNEPFFDALQKKNPVFYIALHFCNKKHRSLIAALIGLYSDWIALPKRLTEPLAIQMRLAWWQQQFDNPDLQYNMPSEILLFKNHDMSPLLTAIEYEYVHRLPEYHCASGGELFKLIAIIMGYPNALENAGHYGRHYAAMTQKTIKTPKHTLPYGLRFLRVPMICHTHTHVLKSLYRLVKNFAFASGC